MNVMDLPDLVSESPDDDSDYDTLDLSGGEEKYEGDLNALPAHIAIAWCALNFCHHKEPP